MNPGSMRNEAGPRRFMWEAQVDNLLLKPRTNHSVTHEDYGLRKQRSEDWPRVHASETVNFQGNRDCRRQLPIVHDRFGDDPESGPKLVLQPEMSPISYEQLVVEVKRIYAGLVMVEAKCIDIDERQVAAQYSIANGLQVTAAQESKEPIWTEHVLRFTKSAAHKVSESFSASGSLSLPKAAFVNKALPMLIKGRKFEARHDTGAEGSNFITTGLMKELGLDIRTAKSDCKAFKTATGTVMRAIGKAKAMCAFAQDSETKLKCWFHVFEKLPSPLIMGAQFLEKTKTMSDFTSRLVDRPLCADLMPMVNLIASTNQAKRRLAAHVDGRYTCINADSGSRLDVMSSTYARAHGYKLNRGRQYRKRVLLADVTKADTIGQVTADVTLEDGRSYYTTFDVLPGLISDVILGESTLDRINAFTIYQSSFVNVFCGERYHELCLLSYLGKLNEYSLRLTRRKYRTQQQASLAKQHDDRMMEAMYEKDLETEVLERERRRAAAGQEAQRNPRDLAAGEGERSNVQASQNPAAISAWTAKRRRIGQWVKTAMSI